MGVCQVWPAAEVADFCNAVIKADADTDLAVFSSCTTEYGRLPFLESLWKRPEQGYSQSLGKRYFIIALNWLDE